MKLPPEEDKNEVPNNDNNLNGTKENMKSAEVIVKKQKQPEMQYERDKMTGSFNHVSLL